METTAPVTEDEAQGIALGATIRRLRIERGYTLNELARIAEIAAGTLSQIERGRVSPSVRTLTKIRTTLGVSLTDLFDTKDEPAVNADPPFVRRRADRQILDLGPGLMIKEFACPSGQGDLVVLELVVAPQGGTGELAYSNPGEKAGFVLRGQIDLEHDGISTRLDEGDGFQFDASKPHRLVNFTSQEARVLWIISPHQPNRSV
jgi:transcriptional regulator with XRE-family HTH domain